MRQFPRLTKLCIGEAVIDESHFSWSSLASESLKYLWVRQLLYPSTFAALLAVKFPFSHDTRLRRC